MGTIALMCGIGGVASISARLPSGAAGLVARMQGSLHHRGPDGMGQWADDRVVLGHRRLSILDLTDAGAQPMVSASERLVIAFNGEIYNFKDLAQDLTESGWVSRSNSDTEVLLECIDRWGLDATLERVDGMFAFALYDRQRQELVLCRDRFGEKPLYYTVQNGIVYFASELKAFDVPGGPELLLDRTATQTYFRYGFIPAPLSIYYGVFKVRPSTTIRIDLAHGVLVDREQLPSQVYWEVPGPRFPGAVSDEQLLDVLRRSVLRRLVSDRPVGAFLSGGVDSSLTCALAAENIAGSLRTFTMGWADKEHDESKQASSVASAIGAVHTCVEMSVSEASSVIGEVGKFLDEPNADGSLIGMYLVAREARKHFVVALSGDGGDELFGGYNRHVWLTRSMRLRRSLPEWSRQSLGSFLRSQAKLLGRLASPISKESRYRLVDDKVRKLSRLMSAESSLAAYDTILAINPSSPAQMSLPPDIVSAMNSNSKNNMLWGLRCADLWAYMPDSILAKVDRASMAVSLETRSAFLEPEVASFGLSMTYRELVDGSGGKAPTRRLADQLLPSCDFHLPKTGFGTPIAEILRGPASGLVEASIANVLTREFPIEISLGNLKESWGRFQAGDDSASLQVWSLVVFELWASERRHEISWSGPK